MKHASKQLVSERWLSLVNKGSIEYDDAQRRVCSILDAIAATALKSTHWWSWLFRPSASGLYLWGNVGRGKTFLIDLFVQSLPKSLCQRWHFHRFMSYIHDQMHGLSGNSDPLITIARSFSKQTRVLCFDELYVEDIGDAMILGRLFRALIEQGVLLVMTSNCTPDQLYRNGLQRNKFVPAIEAIKRHAKVVCLDGEQDWRMKYFEHLPLYLCPGDATAQEALQASFDELRTEPISNEPIPVNGRLFDVRLRSGGIAWFSFDVICCQPTGARDYVELARCFHTIIIDTIPALNDHLSSAVVRFIHLIDELYDRGVKVMISADAPIGHLYIGKLHAFSFARTQSRLHEMQTTDYLKRPHHP